jgi:hypothetical protein
MEERDTWKNDILNKLQNKKKLNHIKLKADADTKPDVGVEVGVHDVYIK